MQTLKIALLAITSVMFYQCESVKKEDTTDAGAKKEKKRPLAIENGKFFAVNGEKYMYGGEDSTWHFKVTNSLLKEEQFHYGIGREKFHALIAPEFINREEADKIFPDSERFLSFKIGENIRAYSIELLTHHEVVNDVVDGKPVMAAYCVLADLGAIYDRNMGGEVFTFALSGYTYYDPEVWDGLDGFVFWDRETESTWWPLIGKGASGPMRDMPLQVYDKQYWTQTTWGEIKKMYPGQEIKVLKPGQEMDPPEDWNKFDEATIQKVRNNLVEAPSVAPKWGDKK